VSERIEDYALLSDLQTAALVGRSGSVDWLCFPRFDSSSCFSALLGGSEHGRWLIAPRDGGPATERRYRADTLILESDWETRGGRVRVTDFMPPRGNNPDIIRIVEGIEGTVTMRTELVIRLDYGSLVPWLRRVDARTLLALGGPDGLMLRTPIMLEPDDLLHAAEFPVREGERIPFVLTWYPSHDELPRPVDAEQALIDTETFWREWIGGCRYDGPYPDAVRNSLIVLKALTYRPTGGILASPTTSLPERVGGPRNWDYRYCWLRDATFSLYALLNAGFTAEARRWRDWLLRAVGGDPAKAQILYGIGGQRRVNEFELDWLPGYAGSLPVRVGNAAHEQFQLDVYGEVMDVLHQARVHGIAPDDHAWSFQRNLLDFLETAWDLPDDGIWEVRGPRRHFTHSKVLAWVAFDRAVQGVQRWGLPGPIERWRRIRQEIHDEVCREGFSVELNAFTQCYGTDDLDASTLLIPILGFLPPQDPRVVGTVEAIQRDLMQDGFVERYKTGDDNPVDGLAGREGAFIPCSFWLVDSLVMLGRMDEATELFERLLSIQNDVGLLSEEYDPRGGRLLGNFPQAFSHVGLVNSAYNLWHPQGPAYQRSRVAMYDD
jgi:GH15 family glucan-1,4-alpha-glucosidase